MDPADHVTYTPDQWILRLIGVLVLQRTSQLGSCTE